MTCTCKNISLLLPPDHHPSNEMSQSQPGAFHHPDFHIPKIRAPRAPLACFPCCLLSSAFLHTIFFCVFVSDACVLCARREPAGICRHAFMCVMTLVGSLDSHRRLLSPFCASERILLSIHYQLSITIFYYNPSLMITPGQLSPLRCFSFASHHAEKSHHTHTHARYVSVQTPRGIGPFRLLSLSSPPSLSIPTPLRPMPSFAYRLGTIKKLKSQFQNSECRNECGILFLVLFD